MFLYALTIFTSAFLLFLVQPLLGKYILPWFGGTPAVWTTCMLFFQLLLLAGYSYAHLIVSQLDRWKQGVLHLTLLGVALVLMVFTFPPSADLWKPTSDGNPTGQILMLLLAC